MLHRHLNHILGLLWHWFQHFVPLHRIWQLNNSNSFVKIKIYYYTQSAYVTKHTHSPAKTNIYSVAKRETICGPHSAPSPVSIGRILPCNWSGKVMNLAADHRVSYLKGSYWISVQKLVCLFTLTLLVFVAGCGYHLSVTWYTRVVLARLWPPRPKVCCILFNIVFMMACLLYITAPSVAQTTGTVLDGTMVLRNELQKHWKGNFSLIWYCISWKWDFPA